MDVAPTDGEIVLATALGIHRNAINIARGRTPGAGQPRERLWSDHILGALGELVVARVLNVYPNLIIERPCHSGDVGEFEVRTTSRRDGHLIIRPRDHDDRIYILVAGVPPILTIAGWITGEDAKRDRWRRDPNGRDEAWFAPQSGLNAFDRIGVCGANGRNG